MNADYTRLHWLRIVVAAAFLCGIIMSPHLWFDAGRSFPRAPIIPGLIWRQDFVLSIVLVVTLVLAVITRRFLAVSVVLIIVLVLLDQTRLQPWVYQYAIMFVFLVFAQTRAVLAANQFVVAALYFWSGLHKLSWSFVHDVAPRLIESAGVHLSPRSMTIGALTIAICESLIGIGLLFSRTRRIAVVVACVMHTIILITLVHARLNTIVWPWNVAMMAITVIIFYRGDETPFKSLRRDYLPKAALLICGLLPALSFVGWWDLYLSGALYSGKSPVAVIRISDTLRDRLSASARETIFKSSRSELMLPLFEWSSAELNVPPYPAVRVYRDITRQLCALDSDSNANALIVKGQPALTNGNATVTVTSCAQLLNSY
ncbi:MAG TPA: hypothetical protein VFI24_18635 [Pyrinomonadaceae bacterium]|nr:hypothetical protein [Pyrinomonadaceae bacterium]